MDGIALNSEEERHAYCHSEDILTFPFRLSR